MPETKLKHKLEVMLNGFAQSLREACKDNLVSVILYGSASSGEFIDTHSNLNVLVVLKNNDLENLKNISGLLKRWKFRLIHPLFFTEDSIRNSNHIFPIEFLDMKENYTVLSGKDVLKDISIDNKNLKFQCEQELRVKLIALKQLYLKKNKDRVTLSRSLFKSFNSILHILRNVLRVKGKQPPYLKQEIIKEIASVFQVDNPVWQEILAARNKQIKLNLEQLDKVFVGFVRDLEKIIDSVDKF